MKRPRRFAALALAGAAALLPLGLVTVPAGAAADEALTVVSTDASSYPDVRMVVAAPAELGDQSLTDAAFHVTEGGQPRTVQVSPLPADQLEVSLAIDTSGSMSGAPLAAAKAAAQSFLGRLPATVPVSVIGFGATPNVVSPRSTNRAAQIAAVNGLAAGGQTALYDALRAALSQLPGSGGRRVIVLLTDGGDTVSTTSLDAASAALAAAQVPLFAVELRTTESNPVALGRLTSASAGRVVPASDPTALAGAFDTIAAQLVRQYAVSYRSEGHGPTDVDVVLEAQGVRAVARPHFDLPAGAAPTATPTTAAGHATASAGSGLGTWALVAGGILCGLAMLSLLLETLLARTPKARGLSLRRRTLDLDAAAERAEALGDTVLRRKGGIAAINAALEAAGLELRAGEFLLGGAAATVVAVVAGGLLTGWIGALALSVAVPLLAHLGLDQLATRRRGKFRDQLPETLQILAGSLRAGHGLAQGIETVARETDSPTAEEFRRLTVEARLGRDFVEALGALSDRMGSEDFEWMVQAVEINREVGGDLAEVLDTVAATIRDRARIRRQVSALSAEGRMSAWVLMILPFGLGAVMAVTNRDYLRPLFHTSTGFKLLAVGAALLAVGGAWLRKIVKPIF